MRAGLLAVNEPATWIDSAGIEHITSRSSGRLKYRTKSCWALRRFVYERDEFSCQICGWVAQIPDNWNKRDALLMSGSTNVCLVVDHIINISDCGSHHPDNLQALCDTCNLIKQNS